MEKSKQGVYSIEERKARERSGSTRKIDELRRKKRNRVEEEGERGNV